MDNSLLKLALKCARGIWEYDHTKKIPSASMIKKVETDTDVLHFWNSSSNGGGFNEKKALSYISESLEEGISNGSVSVDMAEIMFETTEK
jgi:hypothetical protein